MTRTSAGAECVTLLALLARMDRSEDAPAAAPDGVAEAAVR